MKSQPRSVLFVCNSHSVRSPIAAALVRQKLEGKIKVDSCGIQAGELNPFAFGVCEEVGLNLMPHFPKNLRDVDVSQFDLVVALSPESAGEVRSQCADAGVKAPEMEFWFTPDPALEEGSRGQIMLAFRHCRDELEKQIKTRFAYALPAIKPIKS